jgi:hypothetical protein
MLPTLNACPGYELLMMTVQGSREPWRVVGDGAVQLLMRASHAEGVTCFLALPVLHLAFTVPSPVDERLPGYPTGAATKRGHARALETRSGCGRQDWAAGRHGRGARDRVGPTHRPVHGTGGFTVPGPTNDAAAIAGPALSSPGSSPRTAAGPPTGRRSWRRRAGPRARRGRRWRRCRC